MATVKTDEELLAEFDEEMAQLRSTLDPEDLTDFDLGTAMARKDLEAELAVMDEDDDADEVPALPSPAEVRARRAAQVELSRRATFARGGGAGRRARATKKGGGKGKGMSAAGKAGGCGTGAGGFQSGNTCQRGAAGGKAAGPLTKKANADAKAEERWVETPSGGLKKTTGLPARFAVQAGPPRSPAEAKLLAKAESKGGTAIVRTVKLAARKAQDGSATKFYHGDDVAVTVMATRDVPKVRPPLTAGRGYDPADHARTVRAPFTVIDHRGQVTGHPTRLKAEAVARDRITGLRKEVEKDTAEYKIVKDHRKANLVAGTQIGGHANSVVTIRVLRPRRSEDSPAAFSTGVVEFCGPGAPCRPSGDVVRRKGVIWRAGSYAHQGYEMTPGELAEYARTFTPVPVDAGHPSTPSPLDNKLGTLESVEMAADGKTLLGTVVFPRWLEERLGDARRMVSATFNRATRRLQSLSLVLNPAIPDAELVAFAAARGPATSTSTNRRTAMSGETDGSYARRVNATRLGPRSPAEFGGATAAAAPPAPPVLNTMVVTIPAPPTEEEDRQFLARLGALGPLAAAEIGKAIVALDGQANRAPYGFSAFNWPASVRGPVERAERLRAMLAALGSGSGDAYRPPDPEAVAEAQGRTIARLALGKHTLADLVTAVHGRLGFVGPKAAEASHAVDALLASFARHPADGVDALRDRYHKAAREAADWRRELAAVEKTSSGLTPALGAAVGRAVLDAGGPSQVARDLADVRTIAEAEPDPADEELASLEAQLKALGGSAGSADPGRAASALKGRHAELSEAAERRRAEARERVAAESSALVANALAGRVPAWRKLADAAKSHPGAFAERLGRALESCPMEALSEAGFAGLAGVIL